MSISEDVVFIFSGAGGFHFLTFRIYLPFVSGVESQEGRDHPPRFTTRKINCSGELKPKLCIKVA